MGEKRTYNYIIVLHNRTSAYVNFFGFLLSTGSAALFMREMLVRGMLIIPYLAGVVFIAGILIWNAYKYFRLGEDIFFSKALLIGGLVWTRMPYFPWLLIVFVILALLEYQAKRAQEIGFSNDHILFNDLIKKKYEWKEIDNVILKDGLLTIDFKSNRLFQRDIDSGENEASEQEFNDWTRRKLAENGSGQVTDIR